MDNIAKLKKLVIINKDDNYFLKISLLGLYSEWEGGIKKKVDVLLEEVNKNNETKFKLERNQFFNNRNLNEVEFKKIWKVIFGTKFEDFHIEQTFFILRNKYAHGDFESTNLDYDQFKKYCESITEIFYSFENRMDDFINKKEYIE